MANTNNVVSFNEAVIQLQRLNKTAANQEKFAKEDANIQKVIVALDAMGEKELVRTEEIAKSQEKHESKMQETLLEIKNIMLNISKTLEKSLTASIGSMPQNAGAALIAGTEETENQQEADKAKADADKEQHVLLNKMIEGISGLKKATDEGLSKLGATFKEGAAGGGGIMGGISSLLGAGKDLVGGGIKGVGGKIAGAARGGLGMISRAGPLAGIAGLGLAGFNVVNDVMGNIDKSNEVEENVKSGALTRSEGNVLQGESLGSTAGTAAGAAIGGIAGSALGPLGTAAGMWLGSKAGGFVGGVAGKYGVKAYQGVKSLLGFGETKEQEAAKLSPEQKNMQDMASGKIDAEEYNKRMKLQTEGGAATPEAVPTTASATKAETYVDANGVTLKKKKSVSGNDLMKSEVPAEVQSAISAPEVSPTVSNIVATPTQAPSTAKTTGIWDSMKSMGESAWGGIKSGAGWVGDKASAAGAAIAGKASEIGNGVSNWFSGTKIGQDLAKRNVGVGYNGVGVVGGEEKVGTQENLESKDSSTGESSRTFNKGVTVEKSALGSSWLGRMIAGKGTQTESFVADSSKETRDKEGKTTSDYSSSLGQRKSGGWFGKDEYTLTDPTTGKPVSVDKSTYMKAKDIAAKGGDASAIGGLIAKDQAAKEAASMGPATTAMGDQVYGASAETANARDDMDNKKSGGTAVVNAPTNINNTTQQTTPLRSPIRNEENSLNRYYGSRMGVY
jgi:hypothetical protein